MNDNPKVSGAAANDVATPVDVVIEKLTDAEVPGYQAEFDPSEAERAGAFIEDALSEDDAFDSAGDVSTAAGSPASS
jgi:hypothetical protein